MEVSNSPTVMYICVHYRGPVAYMATDKHKLLLAGNKRLEGES